MTPNDLTADIEYLILCKMLEVSDGFQAVAEARITHNFFVDEGNAERFRWMQDHWSTYGASPGEEAFHREYPSDSLVKTPEPLAYYIDELRDYHKMVLLTTLTDEIQGPMKNGDGDIVTKILAAGLEGLHIEVADLHDLDASRTYEDRQEYYRMLAASPGMKGLPTGFASMDQATSGLQKEQLITLVGLQKSYKSMLLMCMNIAAHQAGNRTLFASFEMSTQEQTTRHDALRAGISLTWLQTGKILPWEWKKLDRMGHGLDAMPPMVFVHDPAGTTTVSAIAAKINQHKPDVVFIDGAYLMDPEIPNVEPNSAQALTGITRSLKRLAQRAQIPIVQTTQALTWKTPRGKLTLNSIGYSSSFAQDSDVIFGVEETKDEKGDISDREILLRIIASRNCPRKDVRLLLDLDHGSILEIEEVEYDEDDEDRMSEAP